MRMQLETSRFGLIDVADEDVITFTQPILGFQEFRRFVVLPGPAGGELKWLQSTENGALAFIIMDPRQVVPDYRATLKSSERQELAVETVEELDLYTLVVVPEDRTKIRTNLRAPILINPRQRLGKQAILDQSDYPVQFFLASSPPSPDDTVPNREVSHARSDA